MNPNEAPDALVTKAARTFLATPGDQPAPEPEPYYAPDTVARATLYGKHENVQVVRMDTPSDLPWRTAFLYNGTRFHADSDATDVRVQAVIDPAEVDVDALYEPFFTAYQDEPGDGFTSAIMAGLRAVLSELGLAR